MTITALPAATSIPAVIAIWWPKFRDRRSTLKRGSVSRAATISS